MYNINTDFKTVEEISKKYTFVYITIIQILASKPGTHFAKKTNRLSGAYNRSPGFHFDF